MSNRDVLKHTFENLLLEILKSAIESGDIDMPESELKRQFERTRKSQPESNKLFDVVLPPSEYKRLLKEALEAPHMHDWVKEGVEIVVRDYEKYLSSLN